MKRIIHLETSSTSFINCQLPNTPLPASAAKINHAFLLLHPRLLQAHPHLFREIFLFHHSLFPVLVLTKTPSSATLPAKTWSKKRVIRPLPSQPRINPPLSEFHSSSCSHLPALPWFPHRWGDIKMLCNKFPLPDIIFPELQNPFRHDMIRIFSPDPTGSISIVKGKTALSTEKLCRLTTPLQLRIHQS